MGLAALASKADDMMQHFLLLPFVFGQPAGVFLPNDQPYEVLRPDSAWCGPRIVYFFAHYLGRDCSLDAVVKLCQADDQGFTSMANLVEAAQQLGLEPTPIRCSPTELRKLTGPAIVCLRHPKRKEGPVHFIGLVARHAEDASPIILDPSDNIGLMNISDEGLDASFTGEVILLKDCSRPLVLPSWMPGKTALTLTGLAALMGLGVLIVVRRKHVRA